MVKWRLPEPSGVGILRRLSLNLPTKGARSIAFGIRPLPPIPCLLLHLLVHVSGMVPAAAAEPSMDFRQRVAPTAVGGGEWSGFVGMPVGPVHDPAAMLPEDARKELAVRLATIRETEDLEVLVVLLERMVSVDPAALASELADRGGDAADRAVFLHVAGWPGSPRVAIGGRIVEDVPAKVLETIRLKAERKARSAVELENQIQEGVTVLADELRIVRASLRSGKPLGLDREDPDTLDHMIYRFAKRLPWFVGGFILLVGLVLGVWRMFRSLGRGLQTARPLKFPRLACKRRLGAPYGATVHSPRGSLHGGGPPLSGQASEARDP